MRSSIYDDYKILLHKLHHQSVRDLAWCCFSAPMMSGLPESGAHILPLENDAVWPWIHALDQQPQPLLDHLQQIKSTRLGIYYEALWHFYFENHPDWELLEHNLQISRNGITLGAFDFLCRRGNEYWHIETAVKFYLCIANNAAEARGWEYWIGPVGNDRLDIKLNHLREHQLSLHEIDEAKLLLEVLYPSVKKWSTGLCLQGYLFSPAQYRWHTNYSHPCHVQGHWWFFSEFLEFLTKCIETCWHILERNQWLSPVREENLKSVLTASQLVEKIKFEINLAGRPLLIAAMHQQNPNDNPMKSPVWTEKSRLFVVSDDWPTHSARPGMAAPARNT